MNSTGFAYVADTRAYNDLKTNEEKVPLFSSDGMWVRSWKRGYYGFKDPQRHLLSVLSSGRCRGARRWDRARGRELGAPGPALPQHSGTAPDHGPVHRHVERRGLKALGLRRRGLFDRAANNAYLHEPGDLCDHPERNERIRKLHGKTKPHRDCTARPIMAHRGPSRERDRVYCLRAPCVQTQFKNFLLVSVEGSKRESSCPLFAVLQAVPAPIL